VADGPIIAPLPLIDLGPGVQVVLEAIDPTTGNTVAGVLIVDATIYGRKVEIEQGETEVRLNEYLQEQMV
jgi:hypothetical protein